MSPEARTAAGPVRRLPDGPPRAGDDIDQARIRTARILLGSVIGGGLWLVLGFEWIEQVCAAQGCSGRAELLGLPVAWAATGAVAGGRLARSFDWGTRLAGLALLVWTAFAVIIPAASAPLLAGGLLEALLGLGFGPAFMLHWLLIGGLHVLGWFLVERAGVGLEVVGA